MNMYLDIAVIIVGVISVVGCWLGYHIGRELDNKSKMVKRIRNLGYN